MDPLIIATWNIEKFGAFSKLKKGPGAETWINCTLSAIARITAFYGVDVLVIQEYRKNGRNYLARLQTYLRNYDRGDWSFDYLPGAFKPYKAKADIRSGADLNYTVTANNEGYAVFWKEGLLGPFDRLKMSAGEDGDAAANGYINLLLSGSVPGFNPNANPVIAPNGAGFDNSARFPPPYCANVVNSMMQPGVNDTILLFSRIRRPCWVKINAPGYDGALPFVVYHAPASSPACLYGALACSLTQLAGDNSRPNMVLAGDFNLTTEGQFDTIGDVFHAQHLTKGTPDLGSGEFGYYRTQTQYQKIATNPAELVAANNTYEHPRDVLFYRDTIHEPESGVFDIVAELTKDSLLSKVIFGDATIRAAVIGALDSADANYQLPKVVRDSAALVAAIRAPFAGTSKNFASALAATVFYRCFISDHLPVWLMFPEDGRA